VLEGAEPVWNFGTVTQGSLLKRQLSLANTGHNVLYTYLEPTPGLRLNRTANSVGAADLVGYELLLDTGALPVGPYDRTVILRTSDPNRPIVSVRLVGTIVAPTGDTAGQNDLRPLDVPVTVQGPKNQGEWVTFTHNLGPDPASLHPVKVYSQDYGTLHGVGKYATDFGQGTASYDMFGDGRDGDLVVGAGQTVYVDNVRTAVTGIAAAGQQVIPVANTAGFYVGDEILIIQLRICNYRKY